MWCPSDAPEVKSRTYFVLLLLIPSTVNRSQHSTVGVPKGKGYSPSSPKWEIEILLWGVMLHGQICGKDWSWGRQFRKNGLCTSRDMSKRANSLVGLERIRIELESSQEVRLVRFLGCSVLVFVSKALGSKCRWLS